MGILARMFNGTVASSSSVEGSRTLKLQQIWLLAAVVFYLQKSLLGEILALCIFMFMGLVSRMFNDIVASSSPVRGSGTLQNGIRALVAAWVWMGHKDEVTELMLQYLGLWGPWKNS